MKNLIIRSGKIKGAHMNIKVEGITVSLIQTEGTESGLNLVDTVGLSKASIRKISKKWREKFSVAA